MDRIDEQATDVRHPTPVPRRGRGVRDPVLDGARRPAGGLVVDDDTVQRRAELQTSSNVHDLADRDRGMLRRDRKRCDKRFASGHTNPGP